MSYLTRTADALLTEWLEAFGAILIEGPKWCGKTTTAEQVAKSVIKLQDPDMRDEYLATTAAKPSLLLIGENPRHKIIKGSSTSEATKSITSTSEATGLRT